ncbi:MAG: acyl-CoA thioesterase [Endomicrobiales bacterium]|nr:acyl-CoA thioesterase [Endomicrobiales bacterium]
MRELKIRVSYADTDQMGMVYYANYLVYFERGRTEWLRDHGIAYSDIEKKGVFFPVVESRCKYVSPARYDDVISVFTDVSGVGPASVEFSYKIKLRDKLLATGFTKHPLVNRGMKLVKIPPDIKKVLEKHSVKKNPDS